jgi:hypothetical protein
MAGVSKGADHVTRQFERVHGPDGPTPDADGKRRGTLEVPRLRRRPGDERLKQPVGRGAPNKPDDVTRLQRALSETGDYTFTAPRERSGIMSANLENALTRYQRRTGLEPGGVVAPGGPTIQRVNGEANAKNNLPPQRRDKPDQTSANRGDDRTLAERRNAIRQKEIHAKRIIEDWTRLAESKRAEIAKIDEDIEKLEGVVLPGATKFEQDDQDNRHPSGIPGKGKGKLGKALEFGAEIGTAAVQNLASDKYIASLRNKRKLIRKQLKEDLEKIENAERDLEDAKRKMQDFERNTTRNAPP